MFALTLHYPNGAKHLIEVKNPGCSRHAFWGPQITRASNIELDGGEKWMMQKIPKGVMVRYLGDDADCWQIGHNFADLSATAWKYDKEKYQAFWDGVWPGILEKE